MMYLKCQDPFEREVMEAVAELGSRGLRNLHEEQAINLARAIWG